MRLPYSLATPDEGTKELASKIVQLLVASKLTYKKASEVLETAQTLLEETKPTIPQTLQCD